MSGERWGDPIGTCVATADVPCLLERGHAGPHRNCAQTWADPMTAPLPTPDEVEGMRERHVREVVAVHESGPEAWCPTCQVHWPCDAARLLALVDSQRVRTQHLENVFAQQDDRLDAVLAALPAREWVLAAEASSGSYAEHFVRLAGRVRRAAEGVTP